MCFEKWHEVDGFEKTRTIMSQVFDNTILQLRTLQYGEYNIML